MKKIPGKYRIFYQLEEHLEIPMFILAIVWFCLFIFELVQGLSPFQEDLITVIWILFIIEFLIKLILAPRKLSFIRSNWITIIALIIPALRVFRIFYAIRILRSVRVITSTNIIRALTSSRRFFSALKQAQGPQPTTEMNVGLLVAVGEADKKDQLLAFTRELIQKVKPELENSTGIPWHFDITDSIALENDKAVSPSDFLDSASLRMAEGPYDMVSVITDVGLNSRKNRVEAGLASPVTRICVLSTRKLITTGRKEATLELNDEKVKSNGAVLFLHLTGHLLGLKHRPVSESRIMGRMEFDKPPGKLPSFNTEEKESLRKKSTRIPDRELRNGNFLETFIFHILMTFRHPRSFFSPLFSNFALFLPLSLPSLATAAVAPALLLVFTAETWDVGLGMTNTTATVFAVLSIMFASFYLVRVQSLFLPRKEKRVLTEHLAVANSVIYFSIFLACIGLFLMVAALILLVEFYIFPPDLIQTWPTLNKPEILVEDKIRLAAFISTIGVTTGALAGGLESRTVIQHLALFRSKV